VFLSPANAVLDGHAVARVAAFTPSIHPTHYAALVFPHIRTPAQRYARQEVPGAIKAPDGRGPLRACRPDEASRFSRTDAQLCHPL